MEHFVNRTIDTVVTCCSKATYGEEYSRVCKLAASESSHSATDAFRARAIDTGMRVVRSSLVSYP
jgi:hypothetical protein